MDSRSVVINRKPRRLVRAAAEDMRFARGCSPFVCATASRDIATMPFCIGCFDGKPIRPYCKGSRARLKHGENGAQARAAAAPAKSGLLGGAVTG
jgi:hypothetical protein